MTPDGPVGMLPTVTRRLAKRYIICLLATTGCAGSGGSGTETGNPLVKGNVSYAGFSSAPRDYAVRAPAGIATLDKAWLDLGEAAVSRSGDCGLAAGPDLTLPALGIGDHAAGAHNFTAFETMAADYCSFELPFQVASKQGAAPRGIEGHSLLLEGTLADGTPFSIASSADSRLELVSPGRAFRLDPSAPNVLVAFDFAAWLASLDFDAAERSDSGVVIDESHNTELLQQFEQGLASGVSLYRDRDGDGALDDDPELLARAR